MTHASLILFRLQAASPLCHRLRLPWATTATRCLHSRGDLRPSQPPLPAPPRRRSVTCNLAELSCLLTSSVDVPGGPFLIMSARASASCGAKPAVCFSYNGTKNLVSILCRRSAYPNSDPAPQSAGGEPVTNNPYGGAVGSTLTMPTASPTAPSSAGEGVTSCSCLASPRSSSVLSAS